MIIGDYSNDTANDLSDFKKLKSGDSISEKKYQKLTNTPKNDNGNLIFKRKKSNKKVKFNDKVDIIPVESYKEFNKSDEDYENKILEYFKKNYNDYNNNSSISHSTEQKRNNKKFCNCTCFIL